MGSYAPKMVLKKFKGCWREKFQSCQRAAPFFLFEENVPNIRKSNLRFKIFKLELKSITTFGAQ